MKFLQSAILGLLTTGITTCLAFTVVPRTAVVSPSTFVATRQLQVALSDSDTDNVVAAADDEPLPMDMDPVVAQEEEHKIYVGNLPFTATVADVVEIFEKAEIPVLSVSLPTNPNRVNESTGMPVSKGFAFVSVESDDVIEKAVAALDEFDLDGRLLRVNKLLPKEQLDQKRRANTNTKRTFDVEGRKKLYIGNLPFDATYEDLKDFFAEFGEIHDLYIPMKDGEQRGFAFITMDEENAVTAMNQADGVDFMGRTLTVNEPMDKSEKTQNNNRSRQFKLYVGNLAFTTTKETLQGVFEEFGDVYDCYIPLDPDSMRPRGFAFVTMERENGENAINELDGLELDGRFIRVNEAQGKRSEAPAKRKPSYSNNNNDDGWYNGNNQGDDNDGGY